MLTQSPSQAEVSRTGNTPANLKKTLVRRVAPTVRSRSGGRCSSLFFCSTQQSECSSFCGCGTTRAGAPHIILSGRRAWTGWLPIAGLMNLGVLSRRGGRFRRFIRRPWCCCARVSAVERAGEEGVLLMAVSGGNSVGVLVEVRGASCFGGTLWLRSGWMCRCAA